MCARPRREDDWSRDLEAAREEEQRVADALRAHPLVSRFLDLTTSMDVDFEFVFERQVVQVDLKEKHSPLSSEYCEVWPEVPPADLLLVDEVSWRKLMWREGMGYLLIRDHPSSRWCVLGPWELALSPHRRLERLGDKGNGEFAKGKLLFDLRSAAATTQELDTDALLHVVRQSRESLRKVESLPVRTGDPIPTIPRRSLLAPPVPDPAVTASQPPPQAPVQEADDEAHPAWAGLSRRLSNAIERRWGWTEPTAVQRASFPAILDGHNVLVLAPTAGGKTEAALLPLLDIWHQDGWGGDTVDGGPSILVISPLKALLDDQLERWRRATELVGATAFAWHGDVSTDSRRAFKDEPADALLTTPESLENLLTSPSHDTVRLFSNLRAVVVDEVHAFVGTPRGAQLAALLERLQQVSDAAGSSGDFQRIGLSATVANPEDVLHWLRGGSHREHRVVNGGSPVHGEHLTITSYADIDEAVGAIRSLVTDHRSIVFVRSRRRAEELGNALALPVHHSSVAASGRSQALEDLAAARTHSVIATAGLEMGIDVADLDLVVQDGAPPNPGSYLQRLGRAGRQTGRRRMALTMGTPDDLLLTLGILNRVRRGDLDPLHPRQGARLVLGQQVLAQVLQDMIVGRQRLVEVLRWSSAFAGLDDEIRATVDHLLDGGWLLDIEGRLIAGPATSAQFGGPLGISRLLATFTTAEAFRVETEGGQQIGFLDPSTPGVDGPSRRDAGVVLGGRSWVIVSVDRTMKRIVVRPAKQGRPPSWRGPSLDVSRRTWDSVREVLSGTDVRVEMDDRSAQWLEDERRQWRPRLQSPVEAADAVTMIHSFGGLAVHRAVLAALELEGTPSGPTLLVEASADVVAGRADAVLADLQAAIDAEAARQSPTLPIRHPALIPESVVVAEAREFHVDGDGIQRCLELAAGAPWPS